MLWRAVFFAGVCLVAPAHADIDWDKEFPLDWWQSPGTDEETLEFLNLVNIGLEVNQSPIMRQIACRVGFQTFSKDALLQALKVSEAELDKALRKMRRMELVRVRQGMVLPFGDYSAKLMRRWANEWCSGDDDCGVAE